MSTFNILSIDGGGLRGLVPIRILQKVEEITGKKIQDSFDMFAGTSTGGLIACCLSMRDEQNPDQPKYNLEQIADIYSKKGKQIFPVKSGLGKIILKATNLFAPAYSPSGLDQLLQEYIGSQKIKDALRPILVSTYDLENNMPVIFKSSEANGDESANAKMYDVCRATSAAPTYLPAYSFVYKNKPLTGIDGGVYVNNPTMAVIAEVSKYGFRGFYKKKDGMPVKYDDMRILSLGTGMFTGTITETQAVSWGQLQWITKITDIMMRGVNKSTHYEAMEMLDDGKYLRLNIDITEEKYSDMADATEATRQYLENEVVRQVTNNTATLNQLNTFLGGIS